MSHNETRSYVYVLLCSDNSLYTGYTTDINDRLTKHNLGEGAKYTRARLPVKVIYSEEFISKRDAQKREFEIKSWPRQKKIRELGLENKVKIDENRTA